MYMYVATSATSRQLSNQSSTLAGAQYTLTHKFELRAPKFSKFKQGPYMHTNPKMYDPDPLLKKLSVETYLRLVVFES